MSVIIERAVRIITDGRLWEIAYLHLPIAASDYRLDRIQSNFVKMKQEPQGYNITSDKLVRNTLKITWRFLQETFDDFRRKILTIFLWKVDYVLQKNFTIFGRKFNAFCEKTWRFSQKNLTIFQEHFTFSAGKFDDFCRKIWRSLLEHNDYFSGKLDDFFRIIWRFLKKICRFLPENLQFLQENLTIFLEKSTSLYSKIWRFFWKIW